MITTQLPCVTPAHSSRGGLGARLRRPRTPAGGSAASSRVLVVIRESLCVSRRLRLNRLPKLFFFLMSVSSGFSSTFVLLSLPRLVFFLAFHWSVRYFTRNPVYMFLLAGCSRSFKHRQSPHHIKRIFSLFVFPRKKTKIYIFRFGII